ncbi:hypothetical protein KFZ70_13855 [Tamlana fucoidanivorans]|uniref:Uncharacterized protein n=1 Tax=Allotamlana fucoidanivorans TaxID=2583814 RepID=A0A5C4SQG2_9FLAO|nr:hypothetical protein [Tamlana fucoidanivorans]TNJ46512.1 hypothetical protein FGF67_02470 [Tamlana fucoidanivorans]
MGGFLLRNYVWLISGVELLAALTGLLVLKYYRHTYTRYFIYFLVCIAICDFIGFYTWLVEPDKIFSFLIGTLIEKNYWWSTLYWSIGAIVFYTFYFEKILQTHVFKVTLKVSNIIFLIFAFIYIGLNFDAYFSRFFPSIKVFGAVLIMLCSIFYFIELLNSDKLLNFYKFINFYISFVLFIWWLVITPIVFYDGYSAYEIGVPIKDRAYIILRRYIYLFVNLFMYLTFTFAFIWCRQEAKKSKITDKH